MKDFFNNIKKTWKYTKNNKKEITIYIITCILDIGVSIILPILSAKEIIYLTDNMLLQLIYISIAIFIVKFIRNIMSYVFNKNANIIYRETYYRLELELGREILKLDQETVDNSSTGIFIERLSNDAKNVSDIFVNLSDLLSELIAYIGYFIAIFIINKIMFIFVIISTIITFIFEDYKNKKIKELDKMARNDKDKVSGFIGELVRGLRDIKMLNSENSFINELDKRIKIANKKRYDVVNTRSKYNVLTRIISNIVELLFIILGCLLIYKNALTIPLTIVLKNYMGKISSMINYFEYSFTYLEEFNLSCDRVFELMDGKNFKKETFGNKHINKIKGDFEFKNVTFGYNDNNIILKDLCFKINANETVAFVGKSGAGKSTIFSLLCKMYDIKSGNIYIDGIDIRNLDKDSIRGNITIISQNPYIFNVSICDNLKLVKNDLTEEEMIKACKLACLDDFINTLPDKYNTIIGEGGVNLSGGQKQRLAIARALIQKTEIILFDEATSSLDNETQEKITTAINNMKNEYTILIIAHRLSTIKNANRILYLEDGKILMEGTHNYLMENCNEYKLLYENEIDKN